MNGNVTISLDDYEKLKKSHEEAEKMKDDMRLTMKELQVFLSFVCTRSSLETYVDEYNKQAKSSKIVLSQGRAKIKIIDESKYKSK